MIAKTTLRLIAVCLVAAAHAFAAANFTLIIADAPGVGFNDPTPVAAIGGNTGTTLGQQRRNVFIRAAQLWGAELNSNVPIQIEASWPQLDCDDNGAILGAAGPAFIANNTPGVLPGYWYPIALADKLAAQELIPGQPDIVAFFNRNLGRQGCLTGVFYYLGLDGVTPPGTIDLLETLLHEFGHGLGFLSFTDETNGQFCCGSEALPSIYDRYLLDKNTGLHWDTMTNGQRVLSAVNNSAKLVWDGALATSAVPIVLRPAAEVRVLAPANAVNTFIGGPAAFGSSLSTPVTGELMPVTGSGGLACSALSALDAAAVAGKVAIVQRGTCAFVVKVKNVQNAGAIGAVIANNNPALPPQNLEGDDPTITIPSALVSQSDGAALQNLLRFRSRTRSGVMVRLGDSPQRRAGADEANRVFIFSPSPVQPGSSISHWDVSAFPNLLMEPFDTIDTDFSLKPPGDLTLTALQQLGW